MNYQKFLEKALEDTVEKTQGEKPGARREREIHFGKMKFVYWRDHPQRLLGAQASQWGGFGL